MTKRVNWQSAGVAALLVYLAAVIGVELLRDLTQWPLVAWLASSPGALAHGEWWRLITSAFIVDGPPLPQVLATGILGALIIWFRGTWLFWGIAAAGHVFGTLVTYVGVIVAGTLGPQQLHHFLTAPDYGISLIWCAALGAMAAAWLGPDNTWRVPYRPWLSLAGVAMLGVVTYLSAGFDGAQHIVAFVVGVALVATADSRGKVRRHPAIRHAV